MNQLPASDGALRLREEVLFTVLLVRRPGGGS
jgi:hypothetical protein